MKGENREIFFPKLSQELNLISFDKIAKKYLHHLGYKPVICETEDSARQNISQLNKDGKWPCYFFKSDTTGEKDFEEFFTNDEVIDLDRFINIGVIKSELEFDKKKLILFISKIKEMKENQFWDKQQMIDLFKKLIPNFNHSETNKYLDDKM